LIKKIDNLGRVVVPKGYRVKLGIEPGDPLDIEIEGGGITLSPHSEGCNFCGDSEVATTFLKKNICRDCLERIKLIP
jgi:AbrB family transcriptional regulator, transcriptional pleiotropic regulator of transition state genes